MVRGARGMKQFAGSQHLLLSSAGLSLPAVMAEAWGSAPQGCPGRTQGQRMSVPFFFPQAWLSPGLLYSVPVWPNSPWDPDKMNGVWGRPQGCTGSSQPCTLPVIPSSIISGVFMAQCMVQACPAEACHCSQPNGCYSCTPWSHCICMRMAVRPSFFISSWSQQPRYHPMLLPERGVALLGSPCGHEDPSCSPCWRWQPHFIQLVRFRAHTLSTPCLLPRHFWGS